MTPLFDGTIKEGKLFVDKSESFKQHLLALNGKRVQVTVEKIKHKRTNNQNQYYRGVVVKLIAQHTGHDPEQDSKIPTSTARLDTLEFVEYTEKCRMWANEFLNLSIPLPGEVAA